MHSQNNNRYFFLTGEEFHRFDYGPRENIKKYGQPTPPTYDLSLVKAPVYLYFGDNDPLAPPEVICFRKIK